MLSVPGWCGVSHELGALRVGMKGVASKLASSCFRLLPPSVCGRGSTRGRLEPSVAVDNSRTLGVRGEMGRRAGAAEDGAPSGSGGLTHSGDDDAWRMLLLLVYASEYLMQDV